MNMRKYIIVLFGFLFVTAFLFRGFFILNHGNWRSSTGTATHHFAAEIGNALQRYRASHNGDLPQRLSELVPVYINGTNIQCFFWPPEGGLHISPGASYETVSNMIDTESAFVYLGAGGVREDLVLYEKTNLWPAAPNASVTTLTTNMLALWRSPSDVRTRILRLSKQPN